jgi:hypothetical protein
MAVRNETYAIARPIPYLIQMGQAQTLTFPVRDPGSGALVAPTLAGSTVQIVRPDLTTSLVAAGTAMTAVSGSIAQYDLSAPASTEPVGLGWTVYAHLVIGSTTYVLRSSAIMCEYVPPNVVSAADLYARVPELKQRIPQAQGPRGDDVGWQPQIDEAYYELIQRMLDNGRPIWKCREPTGYRAWLLARARQLAILACPNDSGGWLDRASKDAFFEMQRAEAALVLQYDDEPAEVKRGASQPIRLAPVATGGWW